MFAVREVARLSDLRLRGGVDAVGRSELAGEGEIDMKLEEGQTWKDTALDILAGICMLILVGIGIFVMAALR